MTQETLPLPGRSPGAGQRSEPPSSGSDDDARYPALAGRRCLFSEVTTAGFSFAWYDFESPVAIHWPNYLPPGGGEICLNLAGRGRIVRGEQQAEYTALTAGFYFPGKSQGKNKLLTWRLPKERHQFLTLTLSLEFMHRQLAGKEKALELIVQKALQEPKKFAGFSNPIRLSTDQQKLVLSFRNPPPVAESAQSLWYQAKALEIMGHLLFRPQATEELFCARQKHLAKQRVERVVDYLCRHLAEPFSLEGISREVGCSPYYLSRTFSQEMGVTMIQYLRQVRMEKAAELLRSGQYNVTEAALAVGYSSLSHFSVAFCQTMGCCPGLYPLPGQK